MTTRERARKIIFHDHPLGVVEIDVLSDRLLVKLTDYGVDLVLPFTQEALAEVDEAEEERREHVAH
jgi:hypothetical protein